MDDAPRQALVELIQTYGPALTEDDRRLEGLLRDRVGGYRKEITVLVTAAREGIPHELRLVRDDPVGSVLGLPRLVQRLEDNCAMSHDAAQWAVETWAEAIRPSAVDGGRVIGHEHLIAPQPHAEGQPQRAARVATIGVILVLLASLSLVVVGRAGGFSRAVENGTVALVVVTSLPPADLFINGASAGRTPQELKLPPGSHELVLRTTSYAAWTKRLEITGGELYPVDVRLEPLPASVLLQPTKDADKRPQIGHTRYRDGDGFSRLRVNTSEFLRSDGITATVYLENTAYGVRDFAYTAEMRWYTTSTPGGSAAWRQLVQTRVVPSSYKFEDLTTCAPGFELDAAGSGSPLRLEVWIDGRMVTQFPFRVTGGDPAGYSPSKCADPPGGRRDPVVTGVSIL